MKKNISFIAVRYMDSQIVFIEVYDTIIEALGAADTGNHELLMVGLSPEWTVYVVQGSDWFKIENNTNSGTRWDFMQFLDRMGGEFAGFKLSNFEAINREDF